MKDDNHLPGIFGVIAICDFKATVYFSASKNYLPKFKSKDRQQAVFPIDLKNASVQGCDLLTGVYSNRVINIPIYLQTGNFRL